MSIRCLLAAILIFLAGSAGSVYAALAAGATAGPASAPSGAHNARPKHSSSPAAIPTAQAKSSAKAVQISGEPGGTNFGYANVALHTRWQREGGDYVDANGVPNGPTPHATAMIGGRLQTATLDISRIDGDIFLRFEGAAPPKWSDPRIDDVATAAFWVHKSSRHPLGAPFQLPAFVRNPARGKTLSIQIEEAYSPGQILVDKVDAPALPALPVVRGGLAAGATKDVDLMRRPEVLRYLELKDESALRKWLPHGTVAEPFAYQPEWIAGPHGLPALRFSSDPNNRRLIAWRLRFPPQEEVYARYCLFIEDDVADGMTELGVKLPGLAGDEVTWRMEHGRVAPGNRGVYALVDYLYAAELGRGYPKLRSMGALLQAGRWYSIEQYVKLNTPGQADGIGKVWVNGHLTWESNEVRFRDKPLSRINHVFVNVYHGGRKYVKAPIHYRIAAIAAATSYIGPPPELSLDARSAAGATPLGK